MKFDYLDYELMEVLCYPLAEKLYGNKKEPLGALGNRGLLESALDSPKAQFGGVEQYPKLEQKAAVLHYGLTKNHAYVNGNKRIATIALVSFVWINGYLLKVSDDDLADKTLQVAKSKPEDRDRILRENTAWIKANIRRLDLPEESGKSRLKRLLRYFGLNV